MMLRNFPIKPGPYRMAAGLGPILGSPVDTDDQVISYVQRRQGNYGLLPSDAHVPALRRLGRLWLGANLFTTHGNPADVYSKWLSKNQEDLVVMDSSGRMVFVGVDFPSGWDSGSLLGKTWEEVHKPVPGFNGAKLSEAMVKQQLEREFERWIWTVSADPWLDHRPGAPRRPWSEATEVFLRLMQSPSRWPGSGIPDQDLHPPDVRFVYRTVGWAAGGY